jgi:hypothetical protein
MFPFKNNLDRFFFAYSCQEEIYPGSLHNGHPDKKREWDYVTAIWPTPPPGSINTERAFYREGQKPQACTWGEQYLQAASCKLPSAGVYWDLSNLICFPEIMWHQKPYWLSENNPITPYVCRREELGKVSNLLEVKISNICWHLRHLIYCVSSKGKFVRGPKFLSRPSPCACHLKKAEPCISVWENENILVRCWARRHCWKPELLATGESCRN